MDERTPMDRVIGRVEGRLESIVTRLDIIQSHLDTMLDGIQNLSVRVVTLETQSKSVIAKVKWFGGIAAGIIVLFIATKLGLR